MLLNEESNEVRIDIDEFGEGKITNGEDTKKTGDTSLVVVVSQNQESTDTDLKSIGPDKDENFDALEKCYSPGNESLSEDCRVCQQKNEEALVELGCQCRGELAKAHRSCIDLWFHTRGSNICEICLHVASNIPSLELNPNCSRNQPSDSALGVDPAPRGLDNGEGNRKMGCTSQVWVTFTILICGLMLHVLLSIFLHISGLPMNIIIGVLVVFGLGIILRLALACQQRWNLRGAQSVEINIDPGYNHAHSAL